MLRGLTIALLLGGACTADQAEVARAAEQARPHLALFADFDAWARRARAGAGSHRPQTLAETSFAPLRLERSVLAAWIHVEDGRPEDLSLPPRTPPVACEPGVSLRDARLGTLGVRPARPCPVDVPGWWRPAPKDGCVLISRTSTLTAGRPMTVTVAFRHQQAEASAQARR